MLFKNRSDAGRQLAGQLQIYQNDNPIIFGLARGGLPVAAEVARELKAPLDIIVVRKLAFPQFNESGFGAIAPGSITVLDYSIVHYFQISEDEIESIKNKEEIELLRRLHIYRGSYAMPDLRSNTAIIVDDGIATGISARAAIKYIKLFNPKKLIIAAPVCAVDSIDDIKATADELIYLAAPFDFQSVSQWYEDFPQVSDDEVLNMLNNSDIFFKLTNHVV